MGSAKQQGLGDLDQGWTSIGEKFVCSECFEDEAIKQEIEDNACESKCDYCGRRSSTGDPIAAPIDTIIELICESLSSEWADPVDELSYDSCRKIYRGMTFDTNRLLEMTGLRVTNDALRDDIARASPTNRWCLRDSHKLSPVEALNCGWEDFVEAVKHEPRDVFFEELKEEEDGTFPRPEDVPPSEMLSWIGKSVVEAKLITKIPTGTAYWRARVHKESESYNSARDLGPPPKDCAMYSNRMSPAGIPMFYGAGDWRTAVDETHDPSRTQGYIATVAAFKTAMDLNILDLTSPPCTPSLYDRSRRHLRYWFSFLQKFVADLARPIKKDGGEHIEYLPTQIVTKYFRRRFVTKVQEQVHGILYPSSKNSGGVCCVLFCEQENCVEPKPNAYDELERWLVLDETTVTRVTLPPETPSRQECQCTSS